MRFALPIIDKKPVPLPHFPTRHQAFIFRAYEYVPLERIAEILKTSVANVKKCTDDMGLPDYNPENVWLEKGYITIIRRLWHILPYSQLLELLELSEDNFAFLLKEDDFLDIKLGNKPACDEVFFRPLTEEEKIQTKKIKEIMQTIGFSGKNPFDFEYNVPEITFGGQSCFDTRIIYAFSGLYQHAFDVDSRTFCPDEQLAAYKNLGINGIWTQGILSQLAEFPFDKKLSEGYKKRLERMKDFSERLNKYGIKLYLYLNEPRYMPVEFFEKFPELKGHVKDNKACLCTSTELVQNYIKDSIEEICRNVPLLGGFFTITRSENLTNCYSHATNKTCLCPRCKEKTIGEVIGNLHKCILEGAHRVNKDIKLFSWSWGWYEFTEEIIKSLPKETILITQSERAVPFKRGNVEGTVQDYSMSVLGPGEAAKKEWALAKSYGLDTCAKVQVNTTWEGSTAPMIPVAPLIEKHLEGIKKEGVRNLLLSWTLGGYPSENLASCAKYFYEKCSYSAENTPTYEAQKSFAEAFLNFPFYLNVLYYGPQNAGPSTLLFAENTGYKSTMTCFAYDDIDGWRHLYTKVSFEEQFQRLCTQWEEGLKLLPKNDTSEITVMAEACYCLFRASLNQIRFIQARDEKRYEDMVSLATDELEIAKKMLALMNENASIGYEAANHYYFSKGQLAEKILNCNYIIEKFSKN